MRKANAIPGGTKMPLDRTINDEETSGTSIFDPTLCELCYRWFCPPTGKVLDPFAGGSVRGIVAAMLGRFYTGVELRSEQVVANRSQWEKIKIKASGDANWIEGDSQNVADIASGEYNFLFSCPPYADLEVYSNDPRDLSTMKYEDFLRVYSKIIFECVKLLSANAFACFVVGDVRDKNGFYRGFPWHTVDAFQKAGMHLYNEAVLVTAVGSLPIRAGKQFKTGRKLGKTHQNVLVFVKGDPKKATAAIGDVQFKEEASEDNSA
jgi:DNA modification methylase